MNDMILGGIIGGILLVIVLVEMYLYNNREWGGERMRYIYLIPISALLVLQMVSLGVIYDGIRESSMKDATIASISEQNSILSNDIQDLRNIKRLKEDLGK